MTRDEFGTFVEMIDCTYGRDGKKFFDTKEKITVWFSCLKDLDYKAAGYALKNHICKSPYAPTVADIRKEYAAITTPDADAWALVRVAIRNGTYGAEQEFAKLPKEVQDAVGSPASLTEWAQMPSETVESVIQSYFRKTYATVLERNRTERVLGRVGAREGSLIEEVASRLMIGGTE